MELGISGAGRAVDVGGGDEAAAMDELGAAFAPPSPAGLALEVVERGLDGGGVGGGDLGSSVGAAECPGQRHRPGRREGEVEAGDRTPAGDVLHSQQLPADWVSPGQQSRSAGRARRGLQGQARRQRLRASSRRPRPRRSSSPRRLRRPCRGSSAPGRSRACRWRASASWSVWRGGCIGCHALLVRRAGRMHRLESGLPAISIHAGYVRLGRGSAPGNSGGQGGGRGARVLMSSAPVAIKRSPG